MKFLPGEVVRADGLGGVYVVVSDDGTMATLVRLGGIGGGQTYGVPSVDLTKMTDLPYSFKGC